MQTVKVSSKFQIALPSHVRKKLGIRPGDRLLVDVRGSHVLLAREPHAPEVALSRGRQRPAGGEHETELQAPVGREEPLLLQAQPQ